MLEVVARRAFCFAREEGPHVFRVVLYNVAAQAGIGGEGRSMPQAYRRAYERAQPCFTHLRGARDQYCVLVEEDFGPLFERARRMLGRGIASASASREGRDLTVEIRRGTPRPPRAPRRRSEYHVARSGSPRIAVRKRLGAVAL
jgi:hypothetical protein